MDSDEFRKRGREMVDYIADYLDTIHTRRPLPDVQPGYLRRLIPTEAPLVSDSWEDVFADIERVIMPGVTHWHSPHFYAYYPTANSFPAICGDMLSSAIACVGFSWASSPACTELEVVVMDWLAKMVALPEHFLSGGNGGGIIQGSASEATLVALLSAKGKSLQTLRRDHPEKREQDLLVLMTNLVCYTSDQANSSVERACLLGAVRCHKVPSDDQERMRGEELTKMITADIQQGLVPFYCVATLGSTGTCAFDPLQEIGPICSKFNIWLHVDAAYAGSAFICPEHRHFLAGVEFADSYDFNPHKWMLVNFDCSAMWFKDTTAVVDSFNVDPVYLKHDHQGDAPDYRHWQIPLGRRFRSLKLWFVLRLYGVEGLQAHIRKQISLAKYFEELVKADDRFDVTHEVVMGLVCFRLKGSNDLNSDLLQRINKDGRIHMIAGISKDKYYLRLAICSSYTEQNDIQFAWSVIRELAGQEVQNIL